VVDPLPMNKTKDGVLLAPRLSHGSKGHRYLRLGEGAGELGAGAVREGAGCEGLVREGVVVREGVLLDGETFRDGVGWTGAAGREGDVLGWVCCCSFRDRLKSITR